MNPDRDLAIDIAKFDYLWPKAYPYYSKISFVTKFTRKLVADDIIQFGQLLEKAIATQCGLIRESTVNRDFECGDDAKSVVARTSNHGMSYGAPVTNIYNKTGNLLVTVYERKQNKWYLFRIPNKAYKNIPKTSNIEIPFELDGTPRRVNRSEVNWWKFEVLKFKDLAGG
jgi:hypothetical protein